MHTQAEIYAYKRKNKYTETESHSCTHTRRSLETFLLLPSWFFLKIVLIFRQWWPLCGSGTLLTTALDTVTSASAADGQWGHTWKAPSGETLHADFVIRRTLWLSVTMKLCLWIFKSLFSGQSFCQFWTVWSFDHTDLLCTYRISY